MLVVNMFLLFDNAVCITAAALVVVLARTTGVALLQILCSLLT